MSFEKLNAMLDLDPDTVLIPELCEPASNTAMVPSVGEAIDVQVDATATLPVLDKDVEYARQNITDTIDKVKNALDSAILLAQSGDSPRAFEVVGNMLTAIVSANKELVDLSRAKEETLETHGRRTGQGSGPGGAGGVTIEKAVFVGSPADLIRELRSLNKKTKVPVAEKTDAQE